MRVHRLCPHLEAHDSRYPASSSGTDPREPRKGVSMSFRRPPIEWHSGIGQNPLILTENMATGATVNHTRSRRRPEPALIWRKMSDAFVPPHPKELDRTTSMLRLFDCCGTRSIA